jgi:hypothetical protein
MGELSVRFYSISVSGTDSAGNTGSDTCNVVLMPNCHTAKDGCSSTRELYEKSYSFYPTTQEVDSAIAKSKSNRVLYTIAGSTLHMNTSNTTFPPLSILEAPTFNSIFKPSTNKSCEDDTYIGCSKVSCRDQKKLCDGTWNYHFIAYLMGGETSAVNCM